MRSKQICAVPNNWRDSFLNDRLPYLPQVVGHNERTVLASSSIIPLIDLVMEYVAIPRFIGVFFPSADSFVAGIKIIDRGDLVCAAFAIFIDQDAIDNGIGNSHGKGAHAGEESRVFNRDESDIGCQKSRDVTENGGRLVLPFVFGLAVSKNLKIKINSASTAASDRVKITIDGLSAAERNNAVSFTLCKTMDMISQIALTIEKTRLE